MLLKIEFAGILSLNQVLLQTGSSCKHTVSCLFFPHETVHKSCSQCFVFQIHLSLSLEVKKLTSILSCANAFPRRSMINLSKLRNDVFSNKVIKSSIQSTDYVALCGREFRHALATSIQCNLTAKVQLIISSITHTASQ